MLFKTQFNSIPELGEVQEDTVSLTVPDQTFTIKQILQRAVAGTLDPIAKDVYYDENPDIDRVMLPPQDLTDLDAAREHLRQVNALIDQQREDFLKKAKDSEPSDPISE